ncbi:hypothetical protein Fmac_024375 [Flemingia macrophylla]|uniref:RRM domain-containing protein n=1 Tax=Flemingia macrophylla TaxID=520843 RepID=A0ABD1LP65_9FABA
MISLGVDKMMNYRRVFEIWYGKVPTREGRKGETQFFCMSARDTHVVRDKRTGKTKGYGFVSFANPADLAAALKEMNG